MSSLNDIWIKKETLQTLLNTLDQKQENGIAITISISDEGNQYGNNVSAYISQTKEQREAKADRFWIGNGKTFWTDGKIQVPAKTDQQPSESAPTEGDEDLPF